jgi:hypothetical protein
VLRMAYLILYVYLHHFILLFVLYSAVVNPQMQNVSQSSPEDGQLQRNQSGGSVSFASLTFFSQAQAASKMFVNENPKF